MDKLEEGDGDFEKFSGETYIRALAATNHYQFKESWLPVLGNYVTKIVLDIEEAKGKE